MSARRDASSRVGAAIGQSPSQSERSSLAKKIARFERADENSRGTQKFDGSMGEETARPVGARPMARPARGRYRGAARRAGHARPDELRARGARDKWQPARARHPRQVATQWGRRVRATSEMLPLARRFGVESAQRPAGELVFVLRSQHTCYAPLKKNGWVRESVVGRTEPAPGSGAANGQRGAACSARSVGAAAAEVAAAAATATPQPASSKCSLSELG